MVFAYTVCNYMKTSPAAMRLWTTATVGLLFSYAYQLTFCQALGESLGKHSLFCLFVHFGRSWIFPTDFFYPEGCPRTLSPSPCKNHKPPPSILLPPLWGKKRHQIQLQPPSPLQCQPRTILYTKKHSCAKPGQVGGARFFVLYEGSAYDSMLPYTAVDDQSLKLR